MKIIQGIYKGRNFICAKNTRPALNIVRKACFDILSKEVAGSSVLDLFAGSGSLGLEAISCGAKEAVFVEGDNECIENIKKTAGIFKIEQQTKVYLKDGIKAIKDFFEHKKCFDLIFIDPPYCKGMLKKTLQALEEYDILTPFGYLVCLGYFKGDCPENSKFSLILKRKYGQTLLLIYRK